MFEEDDSILPLTLSVRGPSVQTAGGLTDAIAEEAQSPQRQDLPLDRLLTLLMTTPATETLAQRLAIEDPGAPIPVPVAGRPWEADAGVPELETTDRRTYRAFEQIVLENRKSGKYELAFDDLLQRFPDVEAFAQLKMGYLLNWYPAEAARQFARTQLERHPGWMLVRLQLARSFLKEQALDLNDFIAVLDGRLNLDQHLAELETPLTDLLVYQYHLDLFLFYALQGNLRRAAYCFNACHAAASQPEGLIPLAPLLLASLDPDSGADGFRQLVRFLKP